MLEVQCYFVNLLFVLYKIIFCGCCVGNVLKFCFMIFDVLCFFVCFLFLIFSLFYCQIKDFLIYSLEEGEWGLGDVIFSEGELVGCFNVSQGIVCKVIDELVVENMLVCCQGKGIFVVMYSDLCFFYCFLWLIFDEGGVVYLVSDFFFCELFVLMVEVVEVFGIVVGDLVICVECLLCFSGELVVFDQIYLVGELFDGLILEFLCVGECLLYSLFESDFGVCMICVEEYLWVIVVDVCSVSLLGVNGGDLFLLVEWIVYMYGNKLVEWWWGFYCMCYYYYCNDLGQRRNGFGDWFEIVWDGVFGIVLNV